jgi:site-specific DNA-cytosine methylase
MRFLSLFSGCGGMDLGLERAGFECVGQVEIMPYALKVLKKHWPGVPKHTDILTFCAGAGLAKTTQSLALERVCKENEADSGKKSNDSSKYSTLAGLLGKMFPDFSLSMVGKTSGKSYPTSIRSGIVWRGECWIVNSSESPKDAKECSLLEVLETSVPQKYYLSKKAMRGIVRRAKKDKRTSPVILLELKNQGKERKGISQIQLQENKEGLKDDQGREITLRKLTPREKERLQGFPEDWTLVED